MSRFTQPSLRTSALTTIDTQEDTLEGSPGCNPAQSLFDQKVTLNPDRLLSGNPQKIDDHEIILYKPRWGSFYNTELETHLKTLGMEICSTETRIEAIEEVAASG